MAAAAQAEADSDGRKENNHGVTARMRLPLAGATNVGRQLGAAGPILRAVCHQPFRSPSEPRP